ncbi:MAG TPA: hypothetical protein VHM90_22080, partial [Phycisphaerae bacterium]|nr:hypothetical protein [Phycisphaerae bacterium]
VKEQLEHYRGTFTKLNASKYRFIALFGKEADQPFRSLDLIVQSMFTYAETINSIILYANQDSKGSDVRAKIESLAGIPLARYHDHLTEKDPSAEVTKEIDGIISTMESICRRELEG